MRTEQELYDAWSETLALRRNDYDVTNKVQVSSPSEVCQAVYEIFRDLYPQASFRPLSRAFLDFQRLFNGEYPGYLGCDTVYHDIQHTLDMTLANARLIAGYEKAEPLRNQVGPRRTVVSLITALFHDAGYIRSDAEANIGNGAELTDRHVSRGASFLTDYLPTLGLADGAAVAAQMIHYSGYEKRPEQILMADPKDRLAGHMLGTADLMAQMADRCYLEKCRDRLYNEFVLAGITSKRDCHGNETFTYESGEHLLSKTPDFYENNVRHRLDVSFGGVHRYFASYFGGVNPYQIAIDKSIQYLRDIANGDVSAQLKRRPPVFTWNDDSEDTVIRLVAERLRR